MATTTRSTIAPAGLCSVGSSERLYYDAFVASFDAAGSLSWGSYLGGSDDDLVNGVALGPDGDVYIGVGKLVTLVLQNISRLTI